MSRVFENKIIPLPPRNADAALDKVCEEGGWEPYAIDDGLVFLKRLKSDKKVLTEESVRQQLSE